MLVAANRGVGKNVHKPDVCRTPPVGKPIPYTNTAFNMLAVTFSPIVSLTGLPALNMASVIPTSIGDERGILHWTTKGASAYTLGNPIVSIDGLPAITLTCLTTGNNTNAEGLVAVPSATNVLFTYAALRGVGKLTLREVIERTDMLADSADAPVATLAPCPPALKMDRGGGVFSRSPYGSSRTQHLSLRDNASNTGPPIGASGKTPRLPRPFLCLVVSAQLTGSVSQAEEAEEEELPAREVPAESPAEVGCIRLRVMSSAAVSIVYDLVQRLLAEGMKALVIDLRDNPGGEMQAFVELASDFLPHGAELATVTDADGDSLVVRSRGRQRYTFPLVILVNGGTASAAELFAGCLQAHGRAVLVGEPTYGKGTGQRLVPQRGPNGGPGITEVTLTLPNGQAVQGAGVRPELEISLE